MAALKDLAFMQGGEGIAQRITDNYLSPSP
jgi:hypothetical protein